MSKEKPTLLDDLLEPIRNWRNITPGVLVLPGAFLVFAGAAAFLLTRLYGVPEADMGVKVVLWVIEAGAVVLGAALAVFGFAIKSWPGRK